MPETVPATPWVRITTIAGGTTVIGVNSNGSGGSSAEDVQEQALGIVLVVNFSRLGGIGLPVALGLIFQHFGSLLRRRLLGGGTFGPLGRFGFARHFRCGGHGRHRRARGGRGGRGRITATLLRTGGSFAGPGTSLRGGGRGSAGSGGWHPWGGWRRSRGLGSCGWSAGSFRDDRWRVAGGRWRVAGGRPLASVARSLSLAAVGRWCVTGLSRTS